MVLRCIDCLLLQLDHQAEVKVLNDRLDKERENMKTFKENVKKQFDSRHEQVGSSDCCMEGSSSNMCGAVRRNAALNNMFGFVMNIRV